MLNENNNNNNNNIKNQPQVNSPAVTIAETKTIITSPNYDSPDNNNNNNNNKIRPLSTSKYLPNNYNNNSNTTPAKYSSAILRKTSFRIQNETPEKNINNEDTETPLTNIKLKVIVVVY